MTASPSPGLDRKLTDFAPAKVNLTLRVTGRRADGYHTLESLVAFADIGDRLTLDPGRETSLAVEGEFATGCGPLAGNLVITAFAALSAQIAGLRGGRFVLAKRIPVAAGLGGGSADAAAALRLLADLNAIARDDPRLLAAARAVGSDVPVCLDPRAKTMRGTGAELSPPVELPELAALLVNPGVAVATADVFAAFDPKQAAAAPHGEPPRDREVLLAWLAGTGNDLTAAASARAPVIRQVMAVLAGLPGCRLVRMSGSGATCFALFDAADETEAAAAGLRAARPDWWVYPAQLR